MLECVGVVDEGKELLTIRVEAVGYISDSRRYMFDVLLLWAPVCIMNINGVVLFTRS